MWASAGPVVKFLSAGPVVKFFKISAQKSLNKLC